MPADWRNWFWQDITGNTQYDETLLSAYIDGPLFDLPGGEVQAAFGVEYRTSEIDDSPDIHMTTGNLFNFTTATPTRGDDSVWEAFGEVELPLLANIPGIHELTVNLSGRYTDYESYGSDETYKVSGVYSPVRWLSFRGTVGTSFRAPALFEQFQGDTTGFLSQQNDPCNDYGALDPTTPRFINCDAELNNPDFLATSGIRVVTNGGADSGLAAETSENTTYGVIIQPPLPDWLGDLSLAVDYYNIEVVDQVAQIGAVNILERCYDDPQFRAGGGFCRLVDPRAPGSNALTVFDSYINIATQIAEGYDYNLRYIREFSFGKFQVNALVTQYLSQASKLFDEDPLDEFNATLNNPEYTAVVDAMWTQGPWRFRYGLEWLSAMDSYELVFGVEGIDRADVEPFVFDVDNYYLHHFSVQYTNEGNWQATVGVRNMFDEDPPQISSQAYNRVGNAPLYSGYDYVGRQFFVNLVKEF
jgi:outer membrane receptor protein involved in Fe transport